MTGEPPGYRVLVTPRLERDVRKLTRRDPSLLRRFERLVGILSSDPSNTSRTHAIKKLTRIRVGDGRWRIRDGTYRLRYDIIGRDVVLYSFKPRDQAYR